MGMKPRKKPSQKQPYYYNWNTDLLDHLLLACRDAIGGDTDQGALDAAAHLIGAALALSPSDKALRELTELVIEIANQSRPDAKVIPLHTRQED